MITRRGFIKALAALPFIGPALVKAAPSTEFDAVSTLRVYAPAMNKGSYSIALTAIRRTGDLKHVELRRKNSTGEWETVERRYPQKGVDYVDFEIEGGSFEWTQKIV